MGDFEQDFIRRQIKQLAEALKRIVGRAREEGQVDPMLDELAGKGNDVLGVPWEILAQTDVPSAKMLLGNRADKIEAYAQLLDAEAELLTLRGDANGAENRRARARRLRGGGSTPQVT